MSSGNAVIQLHSAGGRYTLNAESGGDYQVYDNDTGKSVFRYFQASNKTTFDTDFNLSSGRLYKINDIQIDSNVILYLNNGTQLLKTQIDSKQDNLTFGKLNIKCYHFKCYHIK